MDPENSSRQQPTACYFTPPQLLCILLCFVFIVILILILINRLKDDFCDKGRLYLWNRLSIPNALESKNQLFLESIPSPTHSNKVTDTDEEIPEELRILLVGKTGVGKSASGNTILGKKVFKSDTSFSSVTGKGEKFHTIVNRRKVSVIDSPGLFDTSLSEDDVIKRVKHCIPLSAPGLHVILVVIKFARFTKEEANAVKIIQTIFGKEASTYTMALFTHGDKLEGKSIHTSVRESPELLKFIKTCGGRYHVFNNEDKNPDQVIQLLDQIDKLVTGNGGQHYTSEMFERTERAIEEEKQRILKEKEEQMQKEIRALQAQVRPVVFEKEKIIIIKKYEANARHEAERSNSVLTEIGNYLTDALKALWFIWKKMV